MPHLAKLLQVLFACCSRPTAVNLSDAAQKLSATASKAAAASKADAASVVSTVVDRCEAMLKEDVLANKVASAGVTFCKSCFIFICIPDAFSNCVESDAAGYWATWARGHTESTKG